MMDDTLADESGIPVIANSDDIPVHSTPIKGTKIPLPSTRHLMKSLLENGKSYAPSDQEISELPNVPEEKSIVSHKAVGQGQKLTAGESAQNHGFQSGIERDRKDIERIVQTLEDRVCFAGRQVSKCHDGFTREIERNQLSGHHPRSSSESNPRLDPYNYETEDNLRTHFHTKHPRSQSSDTQHHSDTRAYSSHEINQRPYSSAHLSGGQCPNDGRSYSSHERDGRPYSSTHSSDAQRHSDLRSYRSHEKDEKQHSPYTYDKSVSNRTNRELKFENETNPGLKFENETTALLKTEKSGVEKRDNEMSKPKDSFHDLSPRAIHHEHAGNSSAKHNDKQTFAQKGDDKEIFTQKGDGQSNFSSNRSERKVEEADFDNAHSKSDKATSNDIKLDKLNSETLKTCSQRDKSINSFSSSSFQRKETRKPQRHLYGDLDLTPVNKSDAHLNDRTATTSPLARRRNMADTLSEQNATRMKSLSSSVKQASYSEIEVSTIQKQRQEIQLLVAELKDRDRELGDMMNSHQQQLLAWEQDRQRVITLDRKCTQYEAELQVRSTQLQNVHKTLKALKSKYTTQTEEAEINRITVDRLLRENEQLKQQLVQYQDKCELLQKTVQELSNSIGRLQAREEELNTSLKLKEKDIVSATSQLKELSDRLRILDSRCKECQDREKEATKERNVWRQKYEDGTTELQSLRDAVDGKSKQVSQLEEELRSLRHHLSVLQNDYNMREKCQEELIESMRIKQERTDSQLKNFRELYERQLRELSKLQLQLDTSKDLITKQQSSLDEQQISGSYSMRGNSHLSDRSPERQRNTVVQTSRYRDTDSDAHISHQQSSGYQTQVSGNQSELQETQSTTTGTQLHFQSHRINPYESTTAGYRTDSDYTKMTQDKMRPKERHYTSDDAFVRPEVSPKHVKLKITEQKPPSGKEIGAKRPVPNFQGAVKTPSEPPKVAHSESLGFLPQKVAHSDSLGFLPQNNPQPVSNQKHDMFEFSPPRKDGYVIQQTDTKRSMSQAVQSNSLETQPDQQYCDMTKSKIGEHHVENQNLKTGNDHQPEDSRKDSAVCPHLEKPNHESHSKNQFTGEKVDTQAQHTDAEQQYLDPYVFENRLCSFLEDVDDIDEAIWDDQGNISKVIPEGNGGNSPASKLYNLLLESRKMIESLEDTASPPRQAPKSGGQGDQK